MKYLLLPLLSGTTTIAANAQVQIGMKAGANFGNLIDPDPHSSIRVGFQGGALVAIPLSASFCLQPEVNYSTQGSKSTPKGSANKLKETYINVPVLIKYKDASGFFAETGPQIGFLMSANMSGGPGSGDVKSIYKAADLSWSFGFGYFLKSVNAGIDARYNIDITNNLASWCGPGGSIYNSVIQVGVFYLFGAGK